MASPATFVSELVYNHPQHSNVVLEVDVSSNETIKFYLILGVIQKYAPKLHEEFEKIPDVSVQAIPSLDLPPEQMLLKLTSMFIKPKKTLKITDLKVSNESLDAVLKSMYVSPVDITPVNCLEVYKISTRFGMETLSTLSLEVFKKTLKTETLLVDYQKIRTDPTSPMPIVNMYQEALISNLSFLPKDQVLDFTSKLGFALMLSIIESDALKCTEDLVYEMVERWTDANQQTDQNNELMSKVKLELLSNELLLSKVKANDLFINPSTYLLTLERRLTNPVPAGLFRFKTNTIFALGKLDQSYLGYRLTTNTEVAEEKFKKLFKEQYDIHQGVYCLDSFDADVVCCHSYRLTLNGGNWLRVVSKQAKQHNPVKFRTSGHDEEETQDKIGTIGADGTTFVGSHKVDGKGIPVKDNTGLFVKETMKFA
jgi:hypothetical protein